MSSTTRLFLQAEHADQELEFSRAAEVAEVLGFVYVRGIGMFDTETNSLVLVEEATRVTAPVPVIPGDPDNLRRRLHRAHNSALWFRDATDGLLRMSVFGTGELIDYEYGGHIQKFSDWQFRRGKTRGEKLKT